jgi:hypothetical protein
MSDQQQLGGIRMHEMPSSLGRGNAETYVVGYDTARMPTPTKREVVIIPLERGYNVKVGCTTVAFESVASLVAKLEEYLKDPAAAERKWNEGTFFENK